MKQLLQLFILVCIMSSCSSNQMVAQKGKDNANATSGLDELSINGLKWRSIGPALTSGRISDFAMVEGDSRTYYIATSSGGVWKTDNWGTTFKPIFDSQGSYSIGCVTLDPNHHNVVWVGTGENNNQRSVAYGDGIYKSVDGGASWKNVGLKNSEHIGTIVVDPRDSDVVYVAAIGPLWSSGGDRGLYKTTDGGDTWDNILQIDEHTGVNEVHMDPRNPEVLYAVAFQRRRHVFTYLGGGPQSGIWKTTDGGETWTSINTGLPSGDKGRIGMAISPADPEIIYAIVEAADGKGGTYRSTNGGASWQKRGSYSTSGNYYQEIIADPLDPEKLYAMDTWMKVSKDGGRSFQNVGEVTKHVDNHCMWINPQYTDHWIVGCDGGIYETHDAAKTWHFKPNLPITQFYKVAVDNDKPFYNIYGGTQDNFSLGGPSRTTTAHGIMNSDWFVTHGGDGFESQVDPDNPNIIYAQSQYGVLVRYDKSNGEEVGIQPKPRKGEDSYTWNWDAPLAVSHHVPGRIYFAANKLFRSDDKGNSWKVLSDDLTRQINRNELKVMGRVQSIDAVAKNRSTSPYGTIVAFSESPVDQDLLFVGTDDGLIQLTQDGGQTWKTIDHLPGVPQRSYVNSIYASQHDKNVVYVAFNHHKYGDFKPYILKSTDMGITWRSISNNLPDRGSVYTIEEDHEYSNLIFCGTEFGVFFSPDAGGHWKALKSGLPTISVRDITIQREEEDLVIATFGRGFYVMDDYTPLRKISAHGMGDQPALLASRDALMWEYDTPLGLRGKAFLGDALYTADNLGSVGWINYYLPESYSTLKKDRKKKEGELIKNNQDVTYPTYEELDAESNQSDPKLFFSISDASGKVIRNLITSPSKGLNRQEWDLRYNSKDAISLGSSSFYNPFASPKQGTLVEPGEYSIQMFSIVDDEITALGAPQTITVSPLNNSSMPASDRPAKVAFQRDVAELARKIEGAQHLIKEVDNKLSHIKKAIEVSEIPISTLYGDYKSLVKKMNAVKKDMYGDRNKTRLDMTQPPTPYRRIMSIAYEQRSSTAAPTQTHRDGYQIAKEEFAPIYYNLQEIINTALPALEEKLEDAGAPYTPGRAIRMLNGN